MVYGQAWLGTIHAATRLAAVAARRIALGRDRPITLDRLAAITETPTRLPLGAPLQVLRLRRQR